MKTYTNDIDGIMVRDSSQLREVIKEIINPKFPSSSTFSLYKLKKGYLIQLDNCSWCRKRTLELERKGITCFIKQFVCKGNIYFATCTAKHVIDNNGIIIGKDVVAYMENNNLIIEEIKDRILARKKYEIKFPIKNKESGIIKIDLEEYKEKKWKWFKREILKEKPEPHKTLYDLILDKKDNIMEYLDNNQESIYYPKNFMWFLAALNAEPQDFVYLESYFAPLRELGTYYDLVILNYLGHYYAIPVPILSDILELEENEVYNLFRLYEGDGYYIGNRDSHEFI